MSYNKWILWILMCIYVIIYIRNLPPHNSAWSNYAAHKMFMLDMLLDRKHKGSAFQNIAPDWSIYRLHYICQKAYNHIIFPAHAWQIDHLQAYIFLEGLLTSISCSKLSLGEVWPSCASWHLPHLVFVSSRAEIIFICETTLKLYFRT